MSSQTIAARRDAGHQASSRTHALSVAEGVTVAIEGGRTAKMCVEHLRTGWEIAFFHQIDHPLHRFSFVDGVGDHAFQTRAEPDRRFGILGGNAIGRVRIVFDQNDVVRDNVLAEFNEVRGVLRDRKNLRLGLRRREGRIDTDHLACAAVLREACRHGSNP